MRYEHASGGLALDLEDDGTFTLWTFDESEPYIRIWVIREGRSSMKSNELILVAETTTRLDHRERDGSEAEPCDEVFTVFLDNGAPAVLAAFGHRYRLQAVATSPSPSPSSSA